MAIFDALLYVLNGFASGNLPHQDKSVLILSSKHKYVHWASNTLHQNLGIIFNYGKNSFIVLIPQEDDADMTQRRKIWSDLADQLLPTPESSSSNPVIGILYQTFAFS